MAVRPSAPSVAALRARYEQRVERLTPLRNVRSDLVSVAGLIGKPVLNQAGQQDRSGGGCCRPVGQQPAVPAGYRADRAGGPAPRMAADRRGGGLRP